MAEPSLAGGLERPGEDAGRQGIAAADRGAGQQELADQGASRRQLARRRLQVLLRGVVIAGGERDLSQQEDAARARQAGAPPPEEAERPGRS